MFSELEIQVHPSHDLARELMLFAAEFREVQINNEVFDHNSIETNGFSVTIHESPFPGEKFMRS